MLFITTLRVYVLLQMFKCAPKLSYYYVNMSQFKISVVQLNVTHKGISI